VADLGILSEGKLLCIYIEVEVRNSGGGGGWCDGEEKGNLGRWAGFIYTVGTALRDQTLKGERRE
jgi:hypothetical protein